MSEPDWEKIIAEFIKLQSNFMQPSVASMHLLHIKLEEMQLQLNRIERLLGK